MRSFVLYISSNVFQQECCQLLPVEFAREFKRLVECPRIELRLYQALAVRNDHFSSAISLNDLADKKCSGRRASTVFHFMRPHTQQKAEGSVRSLFCNQPQDDVDTSAVVANSFWHADQQFVRYI